MIITKPIVTILTIPNITRIYLQGRRTVQNFGVAAANEKSKYWGGSWGGSKRKVKILGWQLPPLPPQFHRPCLGPFRISIP